MKSSEIYLEVIGIENRDIELLTSTCMIATRMCKILFQIWWF